MERHIGDVQDEQGTERMEISEEMELESYLADVKGTC